MKLFLIEFNFLCTWCKLAVLLQNFYLPNLLYHDNMMKYFQKIENPIDVNNIFANTRCHN